MKHKVGNASDLCYRYLLYINPRYGDIAIMTAFSVKDIIRHYNSVIKSFTEQDYMISPTTMDRGYQYVDGYTDLVNLNDKKSIIRIFVMHEYCSDGSYYDSNSYKTYIPFKKNLSIVSELDILMDKYGDAGRVRYGIAGAFNVALGKIRPQAPFLQEYIRSFLESKSVYTYLHNSCMASTRASLSEANLATLNIVIPPDDVSSSYQEEIVTIRKFILRNNKENELLSALRDFLLPMLMNGQVTIKD